VIIGVGWLALAVFMALRFRQIDGRISPDGQYYASAVIGRHPPRPYSGRPLIPWLARLIPWFDPHNKLRIMATIGVILGPIATVLLCLSLGATQGRAVSAAILMVGMDSFFGSWVMFPFIVDAPAFTTSLLACAVAPSHPTLAGLLLCAAVPMKEHAAVLGLAWCMALGVLSPVWLVPAAAIFAACQLLTVGPSHVAHQSWINRQFFMSQNSKRRYWFLYSHNLSGMKAVPFAIAAIAFSLPQTLAVAVLSVVVLSWLPTLTAMDHSRVVGFCAPWLCATLCAYCPEWAIVPLVLACTFWPLSTEYI
jgi:hypothetical protein